MDLGAPTTTTAAIMQPNGSLKPDFQWVGNGTGVNYTMNGAPITREQFAAGSGQDVGAIEAFQSKYGAAGNGGGGTVLGSQTDPYAASVARNQAGTRASVAVQNAGYQDAATTGIDQYGAGDYNTGILGLVDSTRTGQDALDRNVVNNELERMQGHQGILDMVGNGVRSGGVMLANKNASDSSASEAIAQAYGLLGRQQEAKVGNQYEQGVNKNASAQDVFDVGKAASMRELNNKKNDTINNIVNTTKAQLNSLQGLLAGAGLEDKLDIQNEIQTVKDHAISQLQQYDTMLNDKMGAIGPQSANDARVKAYDLNAAGVPSADQFNYTSEAPLTMQGTGPTPAPLPIYLKSKKTA